MLEFTSRSKHANLLSTVIQEEMDLDASYTAASLWEMFFYAIGTMFNQRRPPARHGSDNILFNSVVANAGIASSGRQVHRELIIYDHSQCLPEYIIFFKYG